MKQAKIWKELDSDALQKKLALLDELACWLAKQPPSLASCAGGDGTLQKISTFLAQFPSPPQNIGSIPVEKHDLLNGRQEFFPLNAEVSYFARVIAAPHFTDSHATALEIYAQLLSCGHLWRKSA